MKLYYIDSIHFVHEDDFQEGEGNLVNSYSLHKLLTADSVDQAIELYITTFLGFNLEWDKADIRDDNKILDYSELVDNDNNKANMSKIENWKLGVTKLYSNRFQMKVHELISREIIKPS